MKSVLCVCLFLCSFYSLQISNQSIFHSIENQNITSSEKSLSYLKLSKELNEKELKYKALDYQYRDTLKWNEEQIKTSEILNCIKYKPLFGDRRSKTHWMVFMK